ncbi:MAG: hypothetical protein SOW59_03655 [Corynebacterium sp.]|nr:hypothetical protein [Corynebacterium sp.]
MSTSNNEWDSTPPTANKMPLVWVVVALFAVVTIGAAIAFGVMMGNRSATPDNEQEVSASENAQATDSSGSASDSNAPTIAAATAKVESSAPQRNEGASTALEVSGEHRATTIAIDAEGEWKCEPQLFPELLGKPLVLYCASGWVAYGDETSRAVYVARGQGSRYDAYASDKKHSMGEGFSCYNRERLNHDGAPKGLVASLGDNRRICGGDWHQDKAPELGMLIGSSDFLPYAQCNGEYVVIVESVLVPKGQTPTDKVLARVNAHPGAVSTYPGVCGSFRPEVDGKAIYPIYVDYGSDRAKACAAAARGEGNARRLTKAADYSSPC